MYTILDRIKYLFSDKFHSILIKKDTDTWYEFRHKYIGIPAEISAIIPNINIEISKIKFSQNIDFNVATEIFYNNILKLIADKKIETSKPGKYILNIFKASYQECIQWLLDNDFEYKILTQEELIKDKRCVRNLLQKEKNVNFIVIDLNENVQGVKTYKVSLFDSNPIDRHNGYKNELVSIIKQTPIIYTFDEDNCLEVINEDSEDVLYLEETEEQIVYKSIFDRFVNIVDKNNNTLSKGITTFVSSRTLTKDNLETIKNFAREVLTTGLNTAEFVDVVDDQPVVNAYLFNISVLVVVEMFLDILDYEKIPIKEINCHEERMIPILWNVHLNQIDYEDYTFVFEILDSIREIINSMKTGQFDSVILMLVSFLKFIRAYLDVNSIIFRVYDIFSKDETLSKLIDFDFSEIIDDDKKDVRFFVVMENITQELVKHNLTFATFSTYFKEV